MNIAYLVLAHSQPQQLVRLIERLDQPNVWFFVHIDKKSQDGASIQQELARFPNVKTISRYEVHWMGFKMVLSTLALLRMAADSEIEFKYYVLMSGQDYPIKSNAYINSFFSNHSEDFMSFAAINDSAENYRNKVLYYHYYDLPYSNPRSSRKVPFLVYLYFGIHKRLRKFLPQRRFYKDYEPFFGSQWFALTNGTVRYILDFVEKNKDYLRFMKYTEGPDETFFHTIILNSERRTHVYDYNRWLEWRKTRREGDNFVQAYSSLRYMDWSDRGKNIPKPATLDDSYYDELKNSAELFARKVDGRVSASLMNRIDKELLGK